MLRRRRVAPLVVILILVICWSSSGLLRPPQRRAQGRLSSPWQRMGRIVEGQPPVAAADAVFVPFGNVENERVRSAISTAAKQHGLSPDLLRAVIWVESGFNPRARSPKGAKGLMQLMPATARAVGVLDVFSPSQNVHGGARYLKDLLERYDGNLSLALAAYNAGPGAVESYGGIPPYPETRRYVSRVMGIYRYFRGS